MANADLENWHARFDLISSQSTKAKSAEHIHVPSRRRSRSERRDGWRTDKREEASQQDGHRRSGGGLSLARSGAEGGGADQRASASDVAIVTAASVVAFRPSSARWSNLEWKRNQGRHHPSRLPHPSVGRWVKRICQAGIFTMQSTDLLNLPS